MIEDTDLLTRIRSDFKDSRKHSSTWRAQTTESYKFIAGGRGQWDEQDVQTLEENGRPIITFNRVGPYIDAVSGNEINSRHTIKYLPRTMGDAHVNEVYTAAVKWVRDNCNAEDEESDSFVDVLACGMGWIETAMEYDQEPDGKIVMNRVDPSQMFWDPSAKKRNLEDRRWQSRSEWMSKEEIEAKWPEKEISPGQHPWLDDPEESGAEPHNATFAFLYRRDQTGYDERTNKYRVIHYQWWEHEGVHRAVDPENGQISTFSESRWETLKKARPEADNLKSVRQKRRVYHQAFVCADTVLEKSVLKCRGFTFKSITGKRNKVENTWYGLVENMKDPQRWANKFFSQILHIINSNAKGGLMAETGAFIDPKKAEEAWADPNAVILLKNGGLAKVKERTAATYPQGLDKLMGFSIGSIPAVAGINLETMGMVDREQAGVLEQERKKATFTILAPFFDSLRRYRKEQGRLLFHFINEYISDGRLIRIKNDQGEQWVPLERQDDSLEYDIIVEEAPTSPNQKQEVWATMGTLIPPLLKAGMPLPPDFFDYSPLPTELAQKMKASISGKLPPQVEQNIQKMQQELQKLAQENQSLKQDMSLDAAKLQSKDSQAKMKADVNMQGMQAEFSARMHEMQVKHEQTIMKLQAEFQAQHAELQQKLAESNDKYAFERWKVEQDNQTKIITAEISAQSSLDATCITAGQKMHSDATKASTEAAKDEAKIEKPKNLIETVSESMEKSSETQAAIASALAQLADSMSTLHASLKPTAAKKVRNAAGDMVAAEVSYQSGETRRIPIH